MKHKVFPLCEINHIKMKSHISRNFKYIYIRLNEIIIYQFKKAIRGWNIIHSTCTLKLGEIGKPRLRDK